MDRYLRSGGWLTEFHETARLEQTISEFLGVKYAVMTNNGTVALALGLMALGIKEGDEVIVPDFTMIATPNAVRMVGAKPVFADIDEGSLCMSPRNLPISKKTKALMHVSLNGRAGEIHEIRKICKKHGIYFIEDSCQAFTSRHKNKYLGTFGELGFFSLSPHKIVTTGQGGVVVTNKKSLYEKVKRLKDFGRLQGGADWHEALGYNFKFTDVQAVIGIGQMSNIKERIKRKKELYRLYQEKLAGIGQVQFVKTDLAQTTPWFVDILVPGQDRLALIEHMKENGIGSRPFYPSINTQPIYKGFSKRKFPVSEKITTQGLWLPSSPFLKKKDVEYVCSKIKRFFEDAI